MNDAPLIKDKRLFTELWRELIFARVLASLLAGFGVAACIEQLEHDLAAVHEPWLIVESLWACMWSVLGIALALSLPSLAAKPQRPTLVYVAGLAFFGTAPAWLAMSFEGYGRLDVVLLMGCLGAGVGMAEGLLEKAIATVFCGLMGGSLAGAGAGYLIWSCAGRTEIGIVFSPLSSKLGAVVALHVGIGLSLAFGRWIRDLPKRKAA